MHEKLELLVIERLYRSPSGPSIHNDEAYAACRRTSEGAESDTGGRAGGRLITRTSRSDVSAEWHLSNLRWWRPCSARSPKPPELSALWITLFYPRKEGTGDLLYLFRLLAGSGMGASIILGVTAIRDRDIVGHRAWMTRAYALALAAGTQVFTQGIGEAVFGAGEVRTDLMLGAGWGINLAIAEWVIRRPAALRTRTRAAFAGSR